MDRNFVVDDSEMLVDPVQDQRRMFLCPSDPSGSPKYPESNYSPNYFLFLNEPGGSRSLFDIKNGMSATMAFSERRGVCIDGGGSWTKRDWRYGAWIENIQYQSEIASADGGNNKQWHQNHTGGISVLMADGKVEFVNTAGWRTLTFLNEDLPH